jgi:hypothetical protein
MLNKHHTKGTMKQQGQGSKRYKRDTLHCRAETRNQNQMQLVYYKACEQQQKQEPMEMHSHVMCLQIIEIKSMLMHSNHRPKPTLPTMRYNKKIQRKRSSIVTRVDKPETNKEHQ